MNEIRMFIAIPVPGAVKKEMVPAAELLAEGNPNIRPVQAEGIHLTLKFLGDTKERRIGDIRKAMESAAKTVKAPIELICSRTGAFPELSKPKVLWAGLNGDVDALGRLWRDLDRRITHLGFAPEKNAFHPHLTLARMKAPKMLGKLRKVWPSVKDREFGRFFADALVLYRSELRPDGAVYTVLERVPLPMPKKG
jgi:RNA 2',3'-cyclic 3'-phosphodiesterase